MMERVVLDFLGALSPELRGRALMPFASSERLNWHYVPRERKGVSLKEMSEPQRLTAKAVLRAALSDKGYRRCEDIMRLEPLVAEIEDDHATYDPLHFVFSVFGEPGGDAPWGWRIDGHHLSLNFVHARDGVSVTPVLYGAHPANVEHGELKGLRVLGAQEDLGRALMRSLDLGARDAALIRDQAFSDILTGPQREKSLRQPQGLELGRMAEAQRNLAIAIIEQFVGTMNPSLAEAQRTRLRQAGIEQIRFAWAGSLRPREPHYYRLHGPTLVIEYDNTQEDANHIHSVWHDTRDEFGADLLRRHYEQSRHDG